MAEGITLRTLEGEGIAVECKSCRMYGELVRKDVVKKYRASVTLSRLRRSLVGACDKMRADGEDKCQARLTSLPKVPV